MMRVGNSKDQEAVDATNGELQRGVWRDGTSGGGGRWELR